MDYTIKRSLRAKKMRLTLKSDGELILVLPKFVPEFAGKIFVQSNLDWIKNNRFKLPPVISSYLTMEIKTGTPIILFDQNNCSVVISSKASKRDCFEQIGDELVLYLRPAAEKSLKTGDRSGSKQVRIKCLIEKFYREAAREYLTERVDYWTSRMGLDYNVIRIKNTKSRWGSCSTKKNLNFNWRIMMAPKAAIDYLVVHEVAHLQQMNHSAKFWSLVKKYDPEFKDNKKWLHDNQQKLLSFLQPYDL